METNADLSVAYIQAYIRLRDWDFRADDEFFQTLSFLSEGANPDATYAQYWVLRDCPWLSIIAEGTCAVRMRAALETHANRRLRWWIETDVY